MRRGALWALVVVAAWLLLGVAWVLWAARSADAGRDRLEEARVELSTGDLLAGRGSEVIAAAERDFERAEARAGSPVTAPLRLLPGVGEQVRSLEEVTSAAAEVAGVARGAVDEASAELNGAVPSGEGRVALLRDVADVAERASAEVAVVDPGSEDGLVGPFATARRDLGEEMTSLELTMLNVRDAANGLADVFDGPSRYLLLAGNNAEMRAASGMYLSIGVLSFEGGELALGDMEPSGDLALEEGVPITDEDLRARWGWAGPNRDWRNLSMSPRFPANAEMASRMWEARTGEAVDGVLAVDPLALQALLGALGPVEVDGEQVDEENVVPLLLHDQYVGAEDQDERREALSEVAEAVVTRFDESTPDLGALAEALRSAASRRHLLVWSSAPALERAWTDVGVGGAVGSDEVVVAVLNDGQNKLDQYLQVESTVTTRPVEEGTEVTLRIELRNETPLEGQPEYVTGEDPSAEDPAGTYEGILAVNLPAGAALVDPDAYAPAGPDGDSQVAARSVRVPVDEVHTEEVSFVVAEGVDSFAVGPSARFPPVVWHHGDRTWADDLLPRTRVAW